MNCIQRNGDITGYSVRHGVQGNKSTQTVIVSEGDTSKTISGLDSFTNYSIEVAAMNSAGTGIFSNPVIQQTDSEFTYLKRSLYNYIFY